MERILNDKQKFLPFKQKFYGCSSVLDACVESSSGFSAARGAIAAREQAPFSRIALVLGRELPLRLLVLLVVVSLDHVPYDGPGRFTAVFSAS